MKLLMQILMVGFLSACANKPMMSALPSADDESLPKPQKQVEAPAPAPAPAPVPEPAPAPEAPPPDVPYQKVKVFFATDRNQTGSKVPKEVFGAERSKLSYGFCWVSIPLDHRIGELESPTIWKLEFREVPHKHVVLLSVAVQSKDEYFKDLTSSVRASKKTSALLFVHGYNTSFEDAARRTAQMSYDLKFEGVPIFYSWPSQHKLIDYMMDESNIEWAGENLRGFLKEFFNRSDAQNVYLIAHSMGNRALTYAVKALLTEQPTIRQRLKEVILAAPDIDAEVFKRDIAPVFAKLSQPATLYASSLDRALIASKRAHGYQRAGDSGGALVVVPGVETIDATGMDTSFLGHSYFAATSSILGDIYYIFENHQRAGQRFGLTEVQTKAGRHWKFKKMQ